MGDFGVRAHLVLCLLMSLIHDIASGGYFSRERGVARFTIEVEDDGGTCFEVSVIVQTGIDPKQNIVAPPRRFEHGYDIHQAITEAIEAAAEILPRHRAKYPEKWNA